MRKAGALLFAVISLAPVLVQAQSQPSPLIALQPRFANPNAPAALAWQAFNSKAASAQHPVYIFLPKTGNSLLDPAAPPSNPAFEAFNAATPAFHVNLNPLFASMSRPGPSADKASASRKDQRYNVSGLLWQSLAFTGFEEAFRLATDPFLRHLLADSPFWNNYVASLGQWRMNRWSDGDDFLVDDIGHPMQGAVSAFIEIQNSPRQRVLRISKTKAYWDSRFKALLWATVFSTQQKIGPLGEAGIGNDGGYTYVQGCAFPCPGYVPGKSKYTNNTGWTDFIMTPVGGTAWAVFEDLLDREISDRVQAHFRSPVFPNILRASLNPARSMANFMRWRNPWYRDYEHYPADRHITPGIHFIPGDEDALRSAPRFEVFPHFNAISLPVNTSACFRCRQWLSGYGVGFSARLSHWFDFDSDMDYHSDASPIPSDRAGGSIIMGTFGLRSGVQYAHYAVKAAVRPGFLSYSDAYETSPTAANPTPSTGRITHFVAALAINADYDINRRFAFRAVVGNTAVRYREPYLARAPGVGSAPYFNWLSHEVFLTNENWTCQTGVVLRF